MGVTMNDAQEIRHRFRRDGVVHLPSFFDRDEIDWLDGALARYERDVVPTLPPSDAFYETSGERRALKQLQRIEQHDGELGGLCQRDKIVRLAELLLDGAVESHGVEWFNKPPGLNRPTPPHQDGYYFCLVPDEALTLWIALDDIDPSNGCLRYVRGSHQQPVRPHGRSDVLGFSQTILDFGDSDLAREYVAVLKRGDALAHHSNTIHWAEANQSDRQRRSAALVFQSARARRDDARWQRYLDTLNQQQQSLGAV